jgi:hypothetical protein
LVVVTILFAAFPAAVLVYFYFFNQFWTHLDLTEALHVREYESDHIRGYRGRQILVHQDFLGLVRRLDDYARMSGVKLLVVHSFRRPAAVLKDAKVQPGQRSNHLAGHALDINIRHGWKLFMFEDLDKDALPGLPPEVQAFVQRIRDDSLMRWGGDFEMEDPVHLDDGINIRDPEQWQRHVAECREDVLSARPEWKRRFLPQKQ